MSPHELPVCEECLDRRKTWVELKDEYFAGYVHHYKEMEEEVRQGHEK